VLLLKSETTRQNADAGEPVCRPAADGLIASPRLEPPATRRAQASVR
jgi:hypothetical protein